LGGDGTVEAMGWFGEVHGEVDWNLVVVQLCLQV
jgi:hypothetical protein